MRENRLYGSEGGGTLNQSSLPLSLCHPPCLQVALDARSNGWPGLWGAKRSVARLLAVAYVSRGTARQEPRPPKIVSRGVEIGDQRPGYEDSGLPSLSTMHTITSEALAGTTR
jgi:hypothetical protein